MESAPPEEIPAPVAAPTTTPATSSAREGVQPSAPNQITTEQLQSQLQTIFQSMAPQISAAETPSVAELLNPEIVLPILRDPAIEQVGKNTVNLTRLQEFPTFPRLDRVLASHSRSSHHSLVTSLSMASLPSQNSRYRL